MLRFCVSALVLASVVMAGTQGVRAAQAGKKEVVDLAKQRDLANDFMRKVAEAALKNASSDKEGLKQKQALEQQLKKPRYFDSGTKAEELADFQDRLAEADKSGIKITDQAAQELIKASVLGLVSEKDLKKIEEEVVKQNTGSSPETVMRAVAAEFRARIVADLRSKKK